MAKKKIYEVSESTEQLADMPKKEREGCFRDRLRTLWFLKTGEAKTMTRAAELCNVSFLTATEWFRRYELGGIRELLHLRTVSGRSRAVPDEVAECLRKRLSEPEGFGSCDEPRIWLKENHDLDIPYKTVHKTVRYYLKGSPKTPRPTHIKKTKRMCVNSKILFHAKCLK